MKPTFGAMIVPPGLGVIASCLLITISACGTDGAKPQTLSSPSVLAPSAPSPPSPPPNARQIRVGEEVTDTLTGHGISLYYQLTAPSDGTLIMRLSWEPHAGLLELKVADTRFMSSPPNWSPPIVANVFVAAGQTYLVTVMDGAPWDYDDLKLPFAITTSME
jgi:hypothetical protein